MLAHAAFSDQVSSNDSFVIGEVRHIKLSFDRVPLGSKHRIPHELRFDVVVSVTCAD